jgi:CDP-diacylglycerol--glycerol-3-phosphate 3-phosphatidyltransferase
MEKENIFNIPNALTLIRILITFPLIYLIFTDASILYIALIFIIGMLTDFFDGFIARNFNLKTEFGRKFDMFADRILMIGTAVSFLIKSPK